MAKRRLDLSQLPANDSDDDSQRQKDDEGRRRSRTLSFEDRATARSRTRTRSNSEPETTQPPPSTSPALAPPLSTSSYADFMRQHSCYTLIPKSSKLVVFDTNLHVKKAFMALVQNSMRAAPVWDSRTQQFVGMLTVTDFINILRYYYRSPLVHMDELEEHRIETWRDLKAAEPRPYLISIDPMGSIYHAVRKLVQNQVHRLPIVDKETGDALYILTHKRLLHFLHENFRDQEQPEFVDKSIRELNVGTYANIASIHDTTPIIVALNVFVERRVSALPILDELGRVIDIYAKFDVMNLAAEKTYNNLDISVKKALEHRGQWYKGVYTCRASDTLRTVINRLVEKQVHRLVIVDAEERLEGVISLSDVLKFLVLDCHYDASSQTGSRGASNTGNSLGCELGGTDSLSS
ncbi:5'-AMP-activated protein kinase subunit gamma-1-like isoform X2 [Oscarella lobularis]